MTPTSFAPWSTPSAGSMTETAMLFEQLAEVRQPKILVLNKVDAVDKPRLLELAARANAEGVHLQRHS